MAAGDLTASSPTFAKTETEIDVQITALNLAAVTDRVFVVPRNNGYLIFKVEREA
mgnify:CR=1 FL=1